MMEHNEYDPDDVTRGLHNLNLGCTLTNHGSYTSVTYYETDASSQGYVIEGYNHGYVDNDVAIAQFYQEELSRADQAEESGNSVVDQQEWYQPSQEQENQGEVDNNQGEQSYDASERSVEIEQIMTQMIPVAHVPKINGELPSEDEQSSDHERLSERLQLYGLVENKMKGDGNCQFRSISDQLYLSPKHHDYVREQVVNQLANNQEMYEGYVPMEYNEYLEKMKKDGEWGDHVTLQAAADLFGVRMFVITSFKDTCYIEILPQSQMSNRLICLSFWAEVHYNSIYPEGELPKSKKKKKKFWPF